ncbi:MAG: hypothetical protein ACYCVZ_00430 [Streptosporangiaceae bacterium]
MRGGQQVARVGQGDRGLLGGYGGGRVDSQVGQGASCSSSSSATPAACRVNIAAAAASGARPARIASAAGHGQTRRLTMSLGQTAG